MSGRKIALVTGASSGIGASIAIMLLDQGYEVYGFGRNFRKVYSGFSLFSSPVFHSVGGDLLDTKWLEEQLKEIPEIDVLINCAGAAYYGLHEELNTKKIQEMTRTNLEVPMMLTQHYLRVLKERHGYVINIASVCAVEDSPIGAAYGATKAGLLSFGNSLFAEQRKYGLRVTTILPDMTKTDLYRNANFGPSEETGAALDPRAVAGAVQYVLEQHDNMCIPEIMLRPQIVRIERKKPKND